MKEGGKNLHKRSKEHTWHVSRLLVLKALESLIEGDLLLGVDGRHEFLVLA